MNLATGQSDLSIATMSAKEPLALLRQHRMAGRDDGHIRAEHDIIADAAFAVQKGIFCMKMEMNECHRTLPQNACLRILFRQFDELAQAVIQPAFADGRVRKHGQIGKAGLRVCYSQQSRIL